MRVKKYGGPYVVPNRKPITYTTKSCGRKHAVCSTCQPDFSEKRRAARIGQHHTDEARAKMKVSQQRIAMDPLRRARISAALRGKKRTPEQRAKLSAARKRLAKMPGYIHSPGNTGHTASPETRIKLKLASQAMWRRPGFKDKMHLIRTGYRCSENCTCRRHMVKDYIITSPTDLEYALQMLLEENDFAYEAQKRFGHYTVDFWLPNDALVFEADGSYWHQLPGNKARDIRRDKYLVTQDRVNAVIRLDEKDLSPWTTMTP